jgi:hypothetical protein
MAQKIQSNLLIFIIWVILTFFTVKTYYLIWAALFSPQIFKISLEKEAGFKESNKKNIIDIRALSVNNNLADFNTAPTIIVSPWDDLNVMLATYPAKVNLKSRYVFLTNAESAPSSCLKVDQLNAILLYECN